MIDSSDVGTFNVMTEFAFFFWLLLTLNKCNNCIVNFVFGCLTLRVIVRESCVIIFTSFVLVMCGSGWLTDDDLTDLDNSTQRLERRLKALVRKSEFILGRNAVTCVSTNMSRVSEYRLLTSALSFFFIVFVYPSQSQCAGVGMRS